MGSGVTKVRQIGYNRHRPMWPFSLNVAPESSLQLGPNTSVWLQTTLKWPDPAINCWIPHYMRVQIKMIQNGAPS